jgi:hypothetical protein
MPQKIISIFHKPTGIKVAEGPKGWGITPFEGNLYISKKYLLTRGFKINYIPGFCPYKFFYFWMDLYINNLKVSSSIAWMYWLPNPIFPFIWYRVGLPQNHFEIEVVEFLN